jgi:hypothetical protein
MEIIKNILAVGAGSFIGVLAGIALVALGYYIAR